MKKSHLLTLFVAVLAIVFGAASAQAAKVDVCHLPPGNPDNWHTISVSENALQAHLNHGDLEGSCLANCETLCDDGDACTQDIESDLDECVCLVIPEPVDCDDGNSCTADSCDSNLGACVYDTSLPNGDACDDGDPDTTGEVCSEGECVVADNGCPCWTEDELDLIADRDVARCVSSSGDFELRGSDLNTGNVDFVLVQNGEDGVFCQYSENTPTTFRFLFITLDEFADCAASVETECADRGF